MSKYAARNFIWLVIDMTWLNNGTANWIHEIFALDELKSDSEVHYSLEIAGIDPEQPNIKVAGGACDWLMVAILRFVYSHTFNEVIHLSNATEIKLIQRCMTLSWCFPLDGISLHLFRYIILCYIVVWKESLTGQQPNSRCQWLVVFKSGPCVGNFGRRRIINSAEL